MAGLRVGYTIAHPDVLRQIVKVRGPFDVNALACAAVLAQLSRVSDMKSYVEEQMTVTKPAVVKFLDEMGVSVWPGAANFLLVQPPDCDEAIAGLRSAGILVRRMSHPSLAGRFRMNLGSPDEMRSFMDVFRSLILKRGG
jgi:histidinol-phosphate aminotransferase